MQAINIEYRMDCRLKSFPFNGVMDAADVFDMLSCPSFLVVEDVLRIAQARICDVDKRETNARGFGAPQAEAIGGNGEETGIRSRQIDIVAISRERQQTCQPTATQIISVIQLFKKSPNTLT
jgi:hypothetical protein